MTIREDEQRLNLTAIVDLYEIDATGIGGNVHRFVPGPWNGDPVRYEGVEYTPTPVELEGVRFGGSLSGRPTLRLSRLDAVVAGAALVGTEHWRGATVSRLRTLTRYLDGEPDADPNRHWPKEIWLIEKLLRADKATVAWQLASPLDIGGRQLPGRQIVRDVCNWRYREWRAGAWNYARAQCPYTGANYFDADDNAATDAADDVCSRRLSGCRARFPGQAIPFGGFLGVGRIRS